MRYARSGYVNASQGDEVDLDDIEDVTGDLSGQFGAFTPPNVYGGPGMMSPAAMLWASQMQPDRYGQAWAPPGATPSALGPALARGGQGPGRGFGPAYLHTRFDSTRQGATTPPGAYLQQDVPMRAAEAARHLGLALQGRGIRLSHRTHRLPAPVVAYGLVFRVTPGSIPQAHQLAGEIAEVNNLYAVGFDMTPAGDEARYAIYFTANPGTLQQTMRDQFDMTRINGFLVEDLRPGGPKVSGLGDELARDLRIAIVAGVVGAVVGGVASSYATPNRLLQALGAATGFLVAGNVTTLAMGARSDVPADIPQQVSAPALSERAERLRLRART